MKLMPLSPRSHSACYSAALAILTLCNSAAAQLLPAGTALRSFASAYSRGSAGLGAGELLAKFAADELRGFGVGSNYQGLQVVNGVLIQARDLGPAAGTATMDVYAYGEDPNNPGYPDLSAPLAFVANVVPNPSAFGITSVNFAPPAQLPEGQDLFVGIRIDATSQTWGGVQIGTLFGSQVTGNYDLSGRGQPTQPPEENSHRLFRDLTTNVVTYEPRGQYMIDLRTVTPSGFPTVRTNQVSNQLSTQVPGGTTMMSSLHPDAASPAKNPGRIDDVGFLFGDPTMMPQSPVAFLASFSDFGPTLPLSSLVPGSVGGLCLDQATLFPLGVQVLNNARAWQETLIPDSLRPAISGRFWTQQAVALDVQTGTLRGTQCGKQQF